MFNKARLIRWHLQISFSVALNDYKWFATNQEGSIKLIRFVHSVVKKEITVLLKYYAI